jgi:outer membrane immunogenic protein
MPASHNNGCSSSRYLFAALSLISISLLTSPAQANTSAWKGSYIGAYIGAASGNNRVSTNVGSVTGSSYFSTAADINAVNAAGTSTKNPGAVIGGIQAGHDWIWNQMIYGVIADYGAFQLNSSTNVVNKTYPDNANQFSVYTSLSSNWLLTLRGRLGFQPDFRFPSFLYLTGGMAVTQIKVNNNFSDNTALAGAGSSSTSQNQIGWTAGAGIEIISFGNTTIDIEGLYVRLPSVKTTGTITNTQAGFGVPARSLSNAFATTGRLHAGLIRVGLNYRFNE